MDFNEEELVQYVTVGCALCGLAIIQNVCILPFIREIAHHLFPSPDSSLCVQLYKFLTSFETSSFKTWTPMLLF